jgi:hypothetical protein
MAGRCAAGEDVDDDHATTAARTRRLAVNGGASGFALTTYDGEQFTRACDVVGAGASGEQAVMVDAVQAFWQLDTLSCVAIALNVTMRIFLTKPNGAK